MCTIVPCRDRAQARREAVSRRAPASTSAWGDDDDVRVACRLLPKLLLPSGVTSESLSWFGLELLPTAVVVLRPWLLLLLLAAW